MNINSHTPGPWEMGEYEMLDAHEIGYPIHAQTIKAQRGKIYILDTTDDADANARTIASAPELLAALAEAVDELEQMHRHYYGNCPGGCPACVAIDKARAAIAKATEEATA